MYSIKKPLNNNVLLVTDEYGKEKILIGDGIGYGAKLGTIFDNEKRVRKVFELSDKKVVKGFHELVNQVDPKLIALVEEQICRIQEDMDVELNDNIHTTLIDHIAFAIDRKKKHLEFRNPFNADIRLLYGEEYSLAEELIYIIKVSYGIELAEDETGIIAIHIHSARQNTALETVKRNTELLQVTLERIQKKLGIEYRKDSYTYQRFLLHMRFAYDRILKHQPIHNDLISEIKKKLPEDYAIINQILTEIATEYGLEISEGEVCYMALHLNRLRNKE
jgi:transcriptional antiterminator